MQDPKDSLNNHKILDDDDYTSLLNDQSLNPFEAYIVGSLAQIQAARVQVFTMIAGNPELTKRFKEVMNEEGEWDVHNHIRHLKIELSSLENDVFGY